MSTRSFTLALAIGAALLAVSPLTIAATPEREDGVAGGARAYEQSRYIEAETRLVALAKTFGPQDTRLATTLNQLGLLYRAQHRYTEAELALKRAAAIWEQARGRERAYAATALNNLAALYHSQRHDNEAEALFRRALEVVRQTLGPEHPQFAAILTNLAVLQFNRGEYASAEELYRRALSRQERALGPRHPDLALTLQDYAKVLRKLHRSVEAAQLEARGKAIRVKHEQ